MGWLYMKSLKGHSGPRQYLDAQLTWERPDTTSEALRSALVGMRVYYAAFEHVLSATGAREVWPPFALFWAPVTGCAFTRTRRSRFVAALQPLPPRR